MKILHCADLHFKKSALEDVTECTRFLVENAQEQEIGLAIIAGDIFDGQIYLEESVVSVAIRFVQKLAGIAPVVILKGTESHDRGSLHIFNDIKSRFRIRAVVSAQQVVLMGSNKGLTKNPYLIPLDCDLDGNNELLMTSKALISCIPSFIYTPDSDDASLITDMFKGFGEVADKVPDIPHIVVGHFTVRGAKVSESQRMIGYDREVSMEQVDEAIPDLVCLGHIHYPQKIGSCTFYSGSLYRTGFGEDEDKGFWIHDVDANGVQSSEFFSTPALKKVVVNLDITEANGDIPQYIWKPECEGADVKLVTTFRDDQAHLIDAELLRKTFEKAHSLKIDMRRIQDGAVRCEAIRSARTLREKLVGWSVATNSGKPPRDDVLEKADMLENMDEEKMLKEVSQSLEE